MLHVLGPLIPQPCHGHRSEICSSINDFGSHKETTSKSFHEVIFSVACDVQLSVLDNRWVTW